MLSHHSISPCFDLCVLNSHQTHKKMHSCFSAHLLSHQTHKKCEHKLRACSRDLSGVRIRNPWRQRPEGFALGEHRTWDFGVSFGPFQKLSMTHCHCGSYRWVCLKSWKFIISKVYYLQNLLSPKFIISKVSGSLSSLLCGSLF